MEILNTDNVTKELIFSILKNAGIKAEYDQDGDILMEDDYPVYLLINKTNSYITIFSNFEENKEKTEEDLLFQTNSISSSYPINALLSSNGGILLKHVIFYGSGITEVNLIESIGIFNSIANEISKDNEYSVFG